MFYKDDDLYDDRFEEGFYILIIEAVKNPVSMGNNLF